VPEPIEEVLHGDDHAGARMPWGGAPIMGLPVLRLPLG
jgi:hypothetical protein